jgi:hypothetical protein
MPLIPKTVEPALNAFENVAENRYSPINEKAQNTRVLKKRLDALEKRNKRWAIVLTLLATGSIAAASYYYGGPLSTKLIAFAKNAASTIKTSKTTAGVALKTKAASYAQAIKNKVAVYGSTVRGAKNKLKALKNKAVSYVRAAPVARVAAYGQSTIGSGGPQSRALPPWAM